MKIDKIVISLCFGFSLSAFSSDTAMTNLYFESVPKECEEVSGDIRLKFVPRFKTKNLSLNIPQNLGKSGKVLFSEDHWKNSEGFIDFELNKIGYLKLGTYKTLDCSITENSEKCYKFTNGLLGPIKLSLKNKNNSDDEIKILNCIDELLTSKVKKLKAAYEEYYKSKQESDSDLGVTFDGRIGLDPFDNGVIIPIDGSSPSFGIGF